MLTKHLNIIKAIRRTTLLILLLCSINVITQEVPLGTLQFSCKILNENDEPMENVTILIYQDSPSRILKADGKSNDKGKFRYMMDLDTDYTVEISMNGYSTKRIKIFTQMVEKEYLNEDYDITLPIVLVKSSIDKIADKKHLYAGIIIWDEETYNFDYDVEKYQLFQEEQDRLIQMAEVKAELDRQKKEQEAIAETERLR